MSLGHVPGPFWQGAWRCLGLLPAEALSPGLFLPSAMGAPTGPCPHCPEVLDTAVPATSRIWDHLGCCPSAATVLGSRVHRVG